MNETRMGKCDRCSNGKFYFDLDRHLDRRHHIDVCDEAQLAVTRVRAMYDDPRRVVISEGSIKGTRRF